MRKLKSEKYKGQIVCFHKRTAGDILYGEDPNGTNIVAYLPFKGRYDSNNDTSIATGMTKKEAFNNAKDYINIYGYKRVKRKWQEVKYQH